MSLRQEQVVLLATLGILGLLGWSAFKTPTKLRGSTSKASKESTTLERHTAPDTKLALPAPRTLAELDRNVFSKPSDTRPLPPLGLSEPPIAPLWGTRPLPSFDIAPAAFAALLRADATPTVVPGLFDVAEDVEVEAQAPEPAPAEVEVELSAQERAQRAESWKKLYDWMRLGDAPPLYGQIRNPDRYGLAARANEPIAFVELKPETGLERFPGQKPVNYERERVKEFAFADTPSNFIQQKKREFSGSIGFASYDPLVAFATQCLGMRNDAREALAVAEEMFELAIRTKPDDPAPRLGLGQCYEAGFQFERAYDLYQELIAQFPHRPEAHVMLGQLEARLRLFESAEERMRTAEAKGGASLMVQLAFGQLLMQRQRFAEALKHLEAAFSKDESAPPLERARIRGDLGAAQLAIGKIDEARAAFDKALGAAPGDARAAAGKLAVAYIAGEKRGAPSAADSDSAGFDTLLSRALLELDARNAKGALDLLVLAAEADPLRASRAWAASSWLAEVTGYPEEALRFIDKALEADPSDAWSHYQHARLLAARDDIEGARAAFVAALDLDLEFSDAMLALAELSRRAGEHADAERYFARVLGAPPANEKDATRRAEMLARRGINLLDLDDVAGARAVFDEALSVDAQHALARVGQAWCTYRGGDSMKAIQQLAELKDLRNARGEEDPFLLFADAQMQRIQDHESKVLWSDRFERRRLLNGWDMNEAVGPTITLEDGAVRIAGSFTSGGRTRVHRPIAGPDFVSLEMDVTVKSSSNAKVALFVAKEKPISAAQTQTQGAIALGRSRSGGLTVLAMDTATADENWEDIADLGGRPWWPADKPVRVRIEFVGEGSERVARLSVDGIGVRDGIRVQRLSASTNNLTVGVFVESQTGLPADVLVDNVEAVYRVRR